MPYISILLLNSDLCRRYMLCGRTAGSSDFRIAIAVTPNGCGDTLALAPIFFSVIHSRFSPMPSRRRPQASLPDCYKNVVCLEYTYLSCKYFNVPIGDG